MLVIIIPVKHPARCNSYRRITSLLENTLQSVCRQTHSEFRVIVVSNATPSYGRRFKDTTFVKVEFPPPPIPQSVDEEHSHVFLDKGSKHAIGLIKARQYNPTHIMFADADDLVSCRLSEFVASRPSQPGWFMEKGYVYSDITKLIEERSSFWKFCGTSHILPFNIFRVPNALSIGSTQRDLINSIEFQYLTRILGDHGKLREFCESKGAPLEPLPFIGAIWRADTGENSSRVIWNQQRFGPIWGRYVSKEISDDFGLCREERSYRESFVTNLWRMRNLARRSLKPFFRTRVNISPLFK